MEEIWKDAVGYEGLYQVSSYGNVKSLDRVVVRKDGQTMTIKGKILTQQTSENGYKVVKVSKNGKSTYAKVHRFVAIAFIDNPDNKPEVNHKDCDKNNNCVDNLEWSTHSENQLHAHRNGLYNRQGESNSCNKVVEEDVVAIRTRKSNGEKLKNVFKDYENMITIHQFKNIWYGYQWKYITI